MEETIKALVRLYSKMDISIEELVNKDIDVEIMPRLLLEAYGSGNRELFDKLTEVNKILNSKRMTNFINKVNEDKSEEVLASLSFLEKINIQVEIEMSHLPNEEKTKLISILEEAIDLDVLKEAQSLGFETVEEYREYNRRQNSRRTLRHKMLSDTELVDL